MSAHHSVVEDAIGHWFSGVVLRVQGFADHVDVSQLPHLLGREEAEL